MVISKSGIHCLFELHIICLPPPPLYSEQSIQAGYALVCLNLLEFGGFFSVGCVCFSFKKVLSQTHSSIKEMHSKSYFKVIMDSFSRWERCAWLL